MARFLILLLIRLTPPGFQRQFGDDLACTLDTWLRDVPPAREQSVLWSALFDLAARWPRIWLQSNLPYVALLSLIGAAAPLCTGAVILSGVRLRTRGLPDLLEPTWTLILYAMFALAPVLPTLILAMGWRRLVRR